MSSHKKKTFDPELLAQYRRLFKYLVILFLFFLVNGVFFPTNMENFPWMMCMVLSYLALILVKNENCNPVQFIARFMNGAVFFSGLIASIHLWIGLQHTEASTYLLGVVHEDRAEAIKFLLAGMAFFTSGWFIGNWNDIASILYATMEACIIVYVWVIFKIKEKIMLQVMLDNLIFLVEEAIANPTIFTYFSWRLLCIQFIMRLVQLSWMCKWGQRVCVGVVIMCFLISQFIGYSSFIYTLLMALFTFPCKWGMQRVFHKDVLLFICIFVQCFALVDFCILYFGVFTKYMSTDSVFYNVFNGMGVYNKTCGANHTVFNSTTTVEDQNTNSYFAMARNMGSLAWYGIKVLTGEEENTWLKMFTPKFWRETFAAFMFVHDLPDITHLFIHGAMTVFKVVVHVYLSNIKSLQLLMGIVFPACIFISIEQVEDFTRVFAKILKYRKRSRTHHK